MVQNYSTNDYLFSEVATKVSSESEEILQTTVEKFHRDPEWGIQVVAGPASSEISYLLHRMHTGTDEDGFYMNFNKPRLRLLHVHKTVTAFHGNDLGEDGKSALKTDMSNSRQLTEALRSRAHDHPVVFDSGITSSHFKLWEKMERKVTGDPLDVPCIDAYACSVEAAFELEGCPDFVLKHWKSKKCFLLFEGMSDSTCESLFEKPSYLIAKDSLEDGSGVEWGYCFAHAERTIFNGLPENYKEAFVQVYVELMKSLHVEEKELSHWLLHTLFAVFEEGHERDMDTLGTSLSLLKKFKEFILAKEIPHFLLPGLNLVERSDCLKNISCVLDYFESHLTLTESTAINFHASADEFVTFLKDRHVSCLKLQILRLRKKLESGDLEQCILQCEAYLRMLHNGDDHMKHLVQAWLMSFSAVKIGKGYLKSKIGYFEELATEALKTEEKYSHLQLLTTCAVFLKYAGNEGLKKSSEYISSVLNEIKKLKEDGTQQLQSSANWKEFENLAFATQVNSLLVLSEPEVELWPDFVTSEEVRMAACPVAGEMVEVGTGFFSLEVFCECLLGVLQWEEGSSDKSKTTLGVAEKVAEELGKSPWDGNEKRFSSHMNMIGRCYMKTGDLDAAERTFVYSSSNFPRPFSAARSLLKKVQKERNPKDKGRGGKMLFVVALGGAAAVGVSLLRGYWK